MLLVEIKVFNALIDNKPFFDQPVKNKQEAYEKLDLSRKTNTSISQQINFVEKLCLLFLKNSKKIF